MTWTPSAVVNTVGAGLGVTFAVYGLTRGDLRLVLLGGLLAAVGPVAETIRQRELGAQAVERGLIVRG